MHRALSPRYSSECYLCESDGIPEFLPGGIRQHLSYYICICIHWFKRLNTRLSEEQKSLLRINNLPYFWNSFFFFFFWSWDICRDIGCLRPQWKPDGGILRWVLSKRKKQGSLSNMVYSLKGSSCSKHSMLADTSTWTNLAVVTDHFVCWGLRSFLGHGTSSAKIRKVPGMVGRPAPC